MAPFICARCSGRVPQCRYADLTQGVAQVGGQRLLSSALADRVSEVVADRTADAPPSDYLTYVLAIPVERHSSQPAMTGF